MTLTRDDFAALRRGLAELPELKYHAAGKQVDPDGIFFPASHAKALDPDVALVVGNRGVGKSYWASALAQEAARERVAQAYRRQLKLDGLTVRFGFADGEGGGDALVSRMALENLPSDTPPMLIWRAVMLRYLASIIGADIPEEFADLIGWIKENPEKQQKIFRAADAYLQESGQTALLLFDQLEQLAEDWESINKLTVGLLQMALAAKSYRSIRLKIFMRPDQYSNETLFQFPDASKIRGEAAHLRWRSIELYALLFFELWRATASTKVFVSLCKDIGISLKASASVKQLPPELLSNEDRQKQIFEFIAGKYMGKSKTRGAPYTWIPLHLSDSRGEVSPRTFLKNLQFAAKNPSVPADSAINYLDINDGVREASNQRLSELQEDYPWISDVLAPLRGLHVPALRDDVVGRWVDDDTIRRVTASYKKNKAPLPLVIASLFSVEEEQEALLNLLHEIGVIDVRQNGKIDVPDIFRVRAGILRRGGVPPQQRRLL